LNVTCESPPFLTVLSQLVTGAPKEGVDVEMQGMDRRQLTRSDMAEFEAVTTPISVAWEDVHFKVHNKGCGKACGGRFPPKTLHILKGVSGCVRPGEMLAIIGGSGAGKSTFLDILAMRKSTGEVTGKVLFNGTPGQELGSLLRRVTGYVTQEDIAKETLTVRETLRFQAELRLDPKTFTPKMREARVEQVMEQLGISHRADMRIGNEEKRGLSGGEKKRVAIGVALVTDPSVLYLDEPTSGLDSYNSLAVIRLLRKLTEMGKTVITTIHQPRSTIFELFDQLLVLNQGQTVYLGPASEATKYFDAIGFPIPPHINPSDFVIDVLLDPDRANMTTTDITDLDFAASYAKSEVAQVRALECTLFFSS
jgi:ABC-type multidrug transport system ATPase subunit